jgi:hypothetical protein
MKKFAVGVVLLAALGAACAKVGSDGPVPDANENAMKAASAAAAESYVGSLEQLAVGSIRASLKAQADAYVGSLGQSAYVGSQHAYVAGAAPVIDSELESLQNAYVAGAAPVINNNTPSEIADQKVALVKSGNTNVGG